MRHFVAIGLVVLPVVLVSGCGQGPPMLAGGKPVTARIQELQNPDAKVRQQAAFKLGNVGPADPDVLPALIGALRDSDPGVRREVILAVVKFGPAAQDAIPALLDLQQHDRDAQVRGYAVKALEKLRSDP